MHLPENPFVGMEPLSSPEEELLRQHLYRAGATPAEAHALLPCFRQEVDTYRWIGLPFAVAIDKVHLEANNDPIPYLRHKYAPSLVMSADELDGSTRDDILFAHRNRAYGAYDLRKSYNRALVNALLLTLGIVLMVLSGLEAYVQGRWTYLSLSGGGWVAGILLVAFASFRCYIAHMTLRMTDEN